MGENFHSSGWPEAVDCFDFSAGMNYESSYLVPFSLPPDFTTSNSTQSQDFPPWTAVPFEGIAEQKAASVSRSHSQAEKRRRDRINAQLAALRKLIPKSDKMDKAALLGSAIERVKDLKRKVAEISRGFPMPTEVDEVIVDRDGGEDQKASAGTIRASVCCDDRPEVLTELIRVLKGLKLSTVKAEIISVGGRMKSNLILCNKNDDQENVCLTTVKQSLNLVLNRIASSSAGLNFRIRSKRQRLLFPSAFENN
ncbi:hypothetical protein SLE2022_107550 [Rubroshorea leprosula]